MTGSLYELDDFGEGAQLQIKNLILPAFVLGIRPLAVIVQLVRSGLIEVMSQDYIRTAKAKGLSPLSVIYNILSFKLFKSCYNCCFGLVRLHACWSCVC